MDRQITAVEREELQRINTELETGKLMSKLRKTSLISKVSQVALAASLVFSLSFLYSASNPVGTGSIDKAAQAKVTITAPVVAEVASNTHEAKPIVLASLKMATALESLNLSAQQPENIAKN